MISKGVCECCGCDLQLARIDHGDGVACYYSCDDVSCLLLRLVNREAEIERLESLVKKAFLDSWDILDTYHYQDSTLMIDVNEFEKWRIENE